MAKRKIKEMKAPAGMSFSGPAILAPLPKKIRMKMTLATPKRCFTAGLLLKVGEDVSEDTARSWLKSGAAEEDKSLQLEMETK
jgi:hypothetical protein